MIRLFYTIVPAARDCGSPVSRAESVRQMHDSAWSLLALSLHRLDPQRFPGGGAGQLPEVRKGPYGKPAFADPSLPAFSLSHSGRVALCAVSDSGPVGADVQYTGEIKSVSEMDHIAADFFHSAEQKRYFSTAEPADRRRLFYTLFCCKESYVKMTGRGLSDAFDGFCTYFGADGVPERILDERTRRTTGYPMLIPFPDPALQEDYVLACCTDRRHAGCRLLYLDLPSKSFHLT